MIKNSEKNTFNAVIVYKLDRFARSRYDSATYKYKLKKNGVQLISATENISNDPEGIILESVLEGMAEFYSAELSQKINRGLRESAYKHNSIGGSIPLGYKTVDKKLVIDDETAPIVREAFSLFANGHTIADICRTFNAKGYRSSKGTRFGKSSFTKIFRNEKYIGVYKFHDYRAENAIPAIIDMDTWNKVQRRLAESYKTPPGTYKAHHTYLLSGKLFCGHCGCRMSANSNGISYAYYECYGKKNMTKDCHKKNMRKDFIEGIVARDALSLLTDERIEEIANVAVNANVQEIETASSIPSIRSRLHETQVSLDNIMKAIETGITPDTLVKRMAELEKEKKVLEAALKKEEREIVHLDKEQVIFWLEQFKNGDIEDEDFKRTIIDLFVNSVTVWDDDPDGYFKITIAYNLTSLTNKTYRLNKDGRLSDFVSNAPVKTPYKTRKGHCRSTWQERYTTGNT
jgi:DNA invertase Pin-like site-specific DNA recombinase